MKARHEKRLTHPWSPEHSPFGRKGASLPPVPDRAQMRWMKHLVRCRRDYWKRRDERLAYARSYHLEHREEIHAYKRAYQQRPGIREHRRDLTRQRFNRVPQEIISLQAREFEQLMVELRREGYTFPEIARMTLQKVTSCRSAYRDVAHRLGLPLQRKRTPCDDTTLLATYREGMSWSELARQLDYANGTNAKRAYMAALERHQQSDCEVAS